VTSHTKCYVEKTWYEVQVRAKTLLLYMALVANGLHWGSRPAVRLTRHTYSAAWKRRGMKCR
jgi:hypothetical protein